MAAGGGSVYKATDSQWYTSTRSREFKSGKEPINFYHICLKPSNCAMRDFLESTFTTGFQNQYKGNLFRSIFMCIKHTCTR